MKIAILSDIHGNIEALQSIADSFDELWVLGDLVNYGPNPGGVIDFVRNNAALVVRGNHDHAIGAGVDPHCSPAYREMARIMQTYTESVLSEDQKAYLRQLPVTARREIDGNRFFLCHAAPSDPLFQYVPSERAFWISEASSVDADVLLVGHTHRPFLLDLDKLRVVNPGSAGQPKHGAPEACYALWEDGVLSFRAPPYPVSETVRKVMDLPIAPHLRSQLVGVLIHGGLRG